MTNRVKTVVKKMRFALVAAVLALAPAVYADDAAADEDTISVVDEGATPDQVVNTIQLPAKSANATAAPQFSI